MPGESLSFNITADDRASSKFRDVGRSALDASAKIDVAAASLKLWDETAKKQGQAANTSLSAMKSHAAATKLLADAENVLAGKATVTTKLLADQGRKLEDAGKTAEGAASGFAGLAGSGGLQGGGMGAAIAAGAVLSPVIATVGVGLGGLGLAALAAGKNSKILAQEMAPLKADFASFQKQLQPVVLYDFAKGAELARNVLHDIEPVAAATGKALGGALSQIGAEFQSGEWQSFFGFMARTAGPDIQLLTANFVGLLKVLPPLLTSLQPVATTLLKDTAGLLNLVSATEKAVQAQHAFSQEAAHSTGWLGRIAHAAGDAFRELVPGGVGVAHVANELGKLGSTSNAAAKGLHATGNEAITSRPPVFDLNKAVAALNASMTTLVGNLLTLQGDDVAWRQSMQAAKKQLDSNTAGLHGNSAAALANKQAVIASTNAAIQFASQQLSLHKDIGQASTTIQAQVRFLQSLHDKSAFVRNEIAALRKEEALLAAQRVRQTISVNASGHFAVFQGSSGHAVGPGGATGAAKGWRVPGTGGGDTVPAMLTPGEAVVPKHLVPAVAPFLKANAVPGFAAGGLVPSYSGPVGGVWPWLKHNDAATVRLFDQAVVKATLAGIRAVQSAGLSAGAGGGGAVSGGAVEALARRMFPWPSYMWTDFTLVENREAGWNIHARNPSSGAYGLAQFINGPSEYYQYGGNPNTAAGQLTGMFNYIRQRYGNPMAAWGHEMSYGWYDKGGFLPAGLSLAYNGTGRPEMVVPGSGARAGAASVTNVYVTVGHGTHPVAAAREIARLLNTGAKSGVKLRTSILGPG